MPALDRMRVLDMTQYEAGTSCTQALAWLGADVVKIEQPGVGDPGRRSRTDGLNSPYFINWNSNKRSVTLNLREPRGRELLLEMLPHYDVFVENYGPGVMERLDLTYEVMQEVNPAIIYARLKGFGLSGPWSGYKCFDPIAQAAAGAFSVTGPADGPPVYPGSSTGDSGTGVELALAITAAYVQKLQTGEGQCVEISMQEAMTYFMRTRVAIAGFGEDAVAQRNGNSLGGPTDLYACKPVEGSDGANDYLYIIANNDRHFGALCETIGRPEFATEPRFNAKWRRTGMGHELFDVIAAMDDPAHQVGGDGAARRGRRTRRGSARHARPVQQSPLRGARLHPRARPSRARQNPPARLGSASLPQPRPDAPRAAARRAHRRGAGRRPWPRRNGDASPGSRRGRRRAATRSPGSNCSTLRGELSRTDCGGAIARHSLSQEGGSRGVSGVWERTG